MSDLKDDPKPGDFAEKINEKASDAVNSTQGKKVYDKGETLPEKMNREKAVFDRDIFFQELYQNYLVAVQRHDQRQLPQSRIIVHWDEATTFEDFLSDALANIDRQIDSIKFAKSTKPRKVDAIGDSVLSDSTFKLDAGSKAIGQQYGNEDYDVAYELLRRAKESIVSMKAGRIQLIVNSKTGRVRVGAVGGN